MKTQITMSAESDKESLVDLTSLRELLGGSVEGMTEIVNLFISHAPPSIVEIKLLMDSRNWPDLKKKIHSIKSYYGYVGNQDLNMKLDNWELSLTKNPEEYNHKKMFAELEDKTKSIVSILISMVEQGGIS